jgi:hypothetical protein
VELTPDDRVRAVAGLIAALFEHVLYDEDPIFIGDEATILDVSMASLEELQKRCSAYYNTVVSVDDLRRPLWQILPQLERQRQAASG